MKPTVDVAVVGGGLVGVSAALCMARSGRSVVMIEPVATPAHEAAWDERCIGLNAASVDILRSLDVWPEVAPQAAPIRSTLVCEAGRFGAASFTAEQAGLDALGYNTPLRAIHQALLDGLAATDATLLRGRQVRGYVAQPDHAVLQLDDGSELQAALVMACDGTESPLRTQAGIPTEAHDYGQSALISTVHTERDHSDCAWERFTRHGPLAVLPRAPRQSTVVWTQATRDTQQQMNADEAAFIAALDAAFGPRLGRLQQPGRRMAYALRRVFATRVTAPRLLLAGNAAQTLHPVAAQGFNLGLRDCAAAAAVAARHDDPGTAAALAAYADVRHEDRTQVARFTDQLVRLFSNRMPVLAGLRHLGLLGLSITPVAHRSVMQQNLGLSALARLRAVPPSS